MPPLVGNTPVQPIRPQPKVVLDETDEELIKLAMIGAFLMGYNGARGMLDAADSVKDGIEDAKKLAEDIISKAQAFGEGPNRTPGDAVANQIKSGLKQLGVKF